VNATALTLHLCI